MCSTGSAWTLLQAGCPIRIPPDHRLLPTPRRFSQVAASFFGSWCLGIHHGPLVACPAYIHSSIAEVIRCRGSRLFANAVLHRTSVRRCGLWPHQHAFGVHYGRSLLSPYSVVNV